MNKSFGQVKNILNCKILKKPTRIKFLYLPWNKLREKKKTHLRKNYIIHWAVKILHLPLNMLKRVIYLK